MAQPSLIFRGGKGNTLLAQPCTGRGMCRCKYRQNATFSGVMSRVVLKVILNTELELDSGERRLFGKAARIRRPGEQKKTGSIFLGQAILNENTCQHFMRDHCMRDNSLCPCFSRNN